MNTVSFYDANGNRTTTGFNTGPGNQLLSDGTWNYKYDAAGNTILKTNIATGEYWTYAWNDANQLTVAADYQSNGTLIQSVTFQYDVFGNRVEEDVYNASTQVTTVTKFAYNANGNIWADLNASNQLVDRRLFVNVNGQTQPFARIDASNNVSWYLTDHLGSIRLITDNTGTVIDQIDYDAWGNITNETNPANGDRYKYASGQFDAVLGMSLHAQNSTGRWYMASNGNWLNADPTGLAAGPNPYDYVENNPTNAYDESGMQAEGITPEAPRSIDLGEFEAEAKIAKDTEGRLDWAKMGLNLAIDYFKLWKEIDEKVQAKDKLAWRNVWTYFYRTAAREQSYTTVWKQMSRSLDKRLQIVLKDYPVMGAMARQKAFMENHFNGTWNDLIGKLNDDQQKRWKAMIDKGTPAFMDYDKFAGHYKLNDKPSREAFLKGIMDIQMQFFRVWVAQKWAEGYSGFVNRHKDAFIADPTDKNVKSESKIKIFGTIDINYKDLDYGLFIGIYLGTGEVPLERESPQGNRKPR